MPKAIEGGVPVNGVWRGELLLEITKGADGGYQERSGRLVLFKGQLGVVEVLGEAMEIDAEEDGFLIEINIAGIFVEGQYLIRLYKLAIVAMLDGVLVPFLTSCQTGMGSAAWWVGTVDGPGLCRGCLGLSGLNRALRRGLLQAYLS